MPDTWASVTCRQASSLGRWCHVTPGTTPASARGLTSGRPVPRGSRSRPRPRAGRPGRSRAGRACGPISLAAPLLKQRHQPHGGREAALALGRAAGVVDLGRVHPREAISHAVCLDGVAVDDPDARLGRSWRRRHEQRRCPSGEEEERDHRVGQHAGHARHAIPAIAIRPVLIDGLAWHNLWHKRWRKSWRRELTHR